MADLILDNIYLVLLLPLWLFLIIMMGRFFSVYVNKGVIYVLTLFSSFMGAMLCGSALWKLDAGRILENEIPFLKIDDFVINMGIHADRTALIFALVLFVVSFIVQLFSVSYMRDEKKSYRFFAFLNLFNFSMAGLLFSPNLFQTYFFWELVSVVSYLLIGFEYGKKEKSDASKKVFIINRIGDTALISGIIMCSYFLYSYSGNASLGSLSFTDMNVISTILYAYTSTPLFLIICGLFIVAAAVKSAQFPFYTWLQDAMEAKLPVSALLHSATMVAAGVFILLRLLPFFTLAGITLKIISVIGILTALICSICASSQNHPKKVLAYSTSAQLGLMFFAVGMLNIKAAVAFFAAHAFIKTLLFLTLPDKEECWNYWNFILFLLGGLSLSGLFISGMAAKEMIYAGLDGGNTVLAVLFCVIAFLTAFYITRIALVISHEYGLVKSMPDKIKLTSYILLILMNIGLYWYLRSHFEYKVAEPFWSALTAWVVVYILYVKNAFWKVPVLYPLSYNGFYLDKFYSETVVKLYNNFTGMLNKFETNVLSNYRPIVFCSKIPVKLVGLIEKEFMDGTVRLIAVTAKRLSRLDMKAQSGNIQRYNAYAFIIVTLILSCLIIAYIIMLSYIGG